MTSTEARWPARLWLVRHGESCGNVARDAAEGAGHAVIDIAERDMDVRLSPTGEQQAEAVGRWLAGRPEQEHPTVVLSSPYVRAVHTAELALKAGRLGDVEFSCDERLREREFGVLDRLTRAGIEAQYPQEAEARRRLGKFYHRPPSGESWCDVALRVRSVLDSIGREHPGENVLVVAHQVVILLFRYVLERMTEQELLAIDRAQDLANCGVTEYVFDAGQGRQGRMVLQRFNDAEAVADAAPEVTAEPDVSVAAR